MSIWCFLFGSVNGRMFPPAVAIEDVCILDPSHREAGKNLNSDD